MENKDAGPAVNTDKQPIFEKLVRKVLTPERLVEFQAANLMMGLEIMHDMDLYPAKYGFTPDQVGSLPNPATDPVAAWAIDHIGDMWEISVGHTAMRLGFVVLKGLLLSYLPPHIMPPNIVSR